MTPTERDYFIYISTTPERARWGVEVLGCGFAKVNYNTPYPVPGHPSDHDFDFENGRTLQALQILFIAQGSGWLKMGSRKRQRVAAGTLVFLPPGIWHSYKPDPKTGWTEHWVEMDGWIVRRLIDDGVISTRQCVFHGMHDAGILELFEKLHSMLRGKHQYAVPELANTAHRLLGLCAELQHAGKIPSRISALVRRAEEHLAAHSVEYVDLEALAKRLGVGYSYFRRVFREQTGLSPWQYILRCRLARARRLLGSGNETLAAVAETCGFGSAFHLSAAFKKNHGISPDTWRKKITLESQRGRLRSNDMPG